MIDFDEMPKKYPFCLAGLLFYRGTIAARYEHNVEVAASYYLSARFSAKMLLRALNEIGISDGELAALPILAGDALKLCFQAGEEHQR
jgi:hypothetical protein